MNTASLLKLYPGLPQFDASLRELGFGFASFDRSQLGLRCGNDSAPAGRPPKRHAVHHKTQHTMCCRLFLSVNTVTAGKPLHQKRLCRL